MNLIPLKRTSCCSAFIPFIVSAHLMLLFAAGRAALAQTAETLAQVKRVSVESFGPDDAAGEVRQSVIHGLRTSGKLTVITDSQKADAIIKGTCRVWITGYFSRDPKVSLREANYQGFLSVEVVGKDSEPLWSYLVTPSTFRTKSITQDLADRIVRELIEALEQESEPVPKSLVNSGITDITVNGAGTAFTAPLYEEWFESFQERHRDLHIVYRTVGTGAGIELLTHGKVDFAAPDMPPSDASMPESKTSFLHFATVLGAVVPVYNLQDIDKTLNFTGEILAGIYLGQIKNWNDPKIRESNPHVRLPNRAIVVIHRSDDSGSTFLWTDYLSKVSPEWSKTVGVGGVVRWPVGEGVDGNEGIAKLVQNTPNSIGYVGLVYALRNQLNFGAVRNAAGEFVHADLDSVTAAANNATRGMISDFRVSIANAPGKDAYPIVTFTWWLLPRDLGDSEKKTALVELLQWVLTSGQRQCSALAYAPLPRDIAKRQLKALSTLK